MSGLFGGPFVRGGRALRGGGRGWDYAARRLRGAAPVHDPRTGRLLGAVDITGGNGLAHPHSLGFV
ncbi:hypothetical protein, partial [Streptomyces fungicidicus]